VEVPGKRVRGGTCTKTGDTQAEPALYLLLILGGGLREISEETQSKGLLVGVGEKGGEKYTDLVNDKGSVRKKTTSPTKDGKGYGKQKKEHQRHSKGEVKTEDVTVRG